MPLATCHLPLGHLQLPSDSTAASPASKSERESEGKRIGQELSFWLIAASCELLSVFAFCPFRAVSLSLSRCPFHCLAASLSAATLCATLQLTRLAVAARGVCCTHLLLDLSSSLSSSSDLSCPILSSSVDVWFRFVDLPLTPNELGLRERGGVSKTCVKISDAAFGWEKLGFATLLIATMNEEKFRFPRRATIA